MSRLVIAFFAMWALALGTASALAQGAVFATPEDAVTAYIEGVKARDFDKVLESVAVDEMYARFDFATYTDWYGALTTTMPAPSSDPFFVELNKADLVAGIGKQVKFFAFGLMTSRKALLDGQVVMMEDGDGAKFMAELDLSRLSGIRVVKIAAARAELSTSAKILAINARNAAMFGADEVTERVVLILFEGQTYLVGFHLMRFGPTWKVTQQAAALAGTNALGVPTAISPNEFDELLK